MRRLSLSFWLLFACACGREPLIFVDIPGEGLASGVLVLERLGKSPLAWAYELDPSRLPLVPPETLEADELAQLHFMGYSRPLAALWPDREVVSHGASVPPAVAGELALELPADGRALSGQIDAGKFSGWTVEDPPARVLTDLRVGTGVSPCPEPMPLDQYFDLDFDSEDATLVPLDGLRVLATSHATPSPRGYVLTSTGVDEIDFGFPLDTVDAGWSIEPDGRVWLAGNSGRVWSGTPEAGFTWTSTIPDSSLPRDLEVLRSGTELAVYLVSDRSFHRFNGEQWTLIHDRGVVGGSSQLSRLLARGLDDIFAIIEDELNVHHFRGPQGTTSVELDATGIRSLVDGGSLGILAASARGNLYRFDPTVDGWEELPDRVDIEPKYIDLLRPGTVTIVSRSGELSAFVEGYGACPTRVLKRGLLSYAVVGEQMFVASPSPVGGVRVEIFDASEPR